MESRNHFAVVVTVLAAALVSFFYGATKLVHLMDGFPWWVNAGGVVGYVLLGLLTGRVVARKVDDDPVVIGACALFWPIAASAVIVIGAGVGSYRLMTRPTKRERLERRHERILEQIAALEAETGIKDAA